MSKAEDQELLLRSAATSCFSAVDQILLGYRQERVSLSKSIEGRMAFSGALLRQAWRSGRPDQAIKPIGLNLAKFAVEAAAVGFGAEGWLIKQKYPPLSTEETTRWHNVWRDMINADGNRLRSGAGPL